MTRIRRLLITIMVPAILVLIVLHQATVTSQPSDEFQPRFSRVLALIRQAEAAGATADELRDIVVTLNKALELNDEALKLTQPDQTQERTQLLTQVAQTLDSLESKANQLENVANQRTYANKIMIYVSGGIAAVLATLAYMLGISFWRRYRIKRTFQMRVVPK